MPRSYQRICKNKCRDKKLVVTTSRPVIIQGRPAPFASSYIVGQGEKRTNDVPSPENNAAGGYQGLVKTELLKGTLSSGYSNACHTGYHFCVSYFTCTTSKKY